MAEKNREDRAEVERVLDEEGLADVEVLEEFAHAGRPAAAVPNAEVIEELRGDVRRPVSLSGGDVDASADDTGEEAVGGENPTPDQDLVDEQGRAMGISYADGEPLHTTEKLERRDEKRWELDPASDENRGREP